ncbi:hypothetical protein WJ96_06155 [Burkholderia ubonensis]|uniref:Uncharacterized protein n=1 Tax=Burkholderia ubonensis TaxID=101571 RepID=A0AAW3MU64_9BURK|nr:hypothetical protein [Burkholderia ubonensis]KVP75341.1 hypothetical protein WJ93_07960 [Burkholderia ubonensis]KVP98152.1 hypothetical protein WJ96_06155 [Burkholderia ubonensis]KVZ92850.1 hypothetical protein WL25_17820 [Burkholderia ubonensis]
MSLLTVFARREPTVDPVALAHGCADKKDTVFYRDAQCTDVMARKPWHQSGHPRKNSTAVTLNCFRWKLQWAH